MYRSYGTVHSQCVVETVALICSASFVAEILVRSPQKTVIFFILKKKFWIKVSKKIFYLILKKEALVICTTVLRHTYMQCVQVHQEDVIGCIRSVRLFKALVVSPN